MNGSAALPERLSGLLSPVAYPHPVTEVRVIQTQLSWVLLAGERVYKIKRPAHLPFADFRLLDDRRRLCHEELRLNRRFVRGLYLDVCAITGHGEGARIGGTGSATEYAVVMRRFDEQQQLDRLVRDKRVNEDEIESFARHLADLQRTLPVPADSSAASLALSVVASADRNAQECAGFAATLGTAERIRVAGQRLLEAMRARRAAFAWRDQAHVVRECHADLHLSNVVRLDGQLQPFDCLEFDPALRWIDVAQDAAFLCADLLGYGEPRLANVFLNAWLARTGDYHACAIMPLHIADRALVRAKVMALLAGDQPSESTGHRLHAGRHDRYLAVAERALQRAPGCCVMLTGLPASGKSWLARQLAPQLDAIHIRSDLERQRLADVAATAHGHSPIHGGIYTTGRTAATYERLERCVAEVVSGGYTALVDANFGLRAQRAALAQLCGMMEVPLHVIHCEAPAAVLRQRIASRMREGHDASEADQNVLEAKLLEREAIVPTEQLDVIAADTTRADVEMTVLAELERRRAVAKPT